MSYKEKGYGSVLTGSGGTKRFHHDLKSEKKAISFIKGKGETLTGDKMTNKALQVAINKAKK